MGKRVIDKLLPQVRQNCLISDARFWGYYSTCGLLLRLREQFRFEEDIPPDEAVDISTVGPWIEKRETQWQRLESEHLREIEIDGKAYDPFDAEEISSLIEPEGFIYGGGKGVYMKPVFFLAKLRSQRTLGPYSVFTADKELVRDLSIHPAMSREGVIVARSDMALAMLRDRFEEYKASRRQGMLSNAFEAYGIGADSGTERINTAADSELEAYIRHEYGELIESDRLGPDWAGLIEALGTSRTGLELRGVKDALADTTEGGMLNHIIEGEKTGSLYFYAASLTGLRYTLAAAVREAVKGFTDSHDWRVIEKARAASYKISRDVADECLEAYHNSKPEDLDENEKAALLRACPINR